MKNQEIGGAQKKKRGKELAGGHVLTEYDLTLSLQNMHYNLIL
jgi:hypothetical protein